MKSRVFLRNLISVFLGLAAGLFLLAAPVLAADCPTASPLGVGCPSEPSQQYYCNGACRSSQTQCVGGWTPSPICASGFACDNFITADACGYGATCNTSTHTRCGAWPNYTCIATIAPVSPCNHYDTCNDYCDGCTTGYTLCGSTHICVANLTCLPGQTFMPCTNTCEGEVSMLKLGYDSVSGTNIIQSTTYPTLYIPSSQNVGIGTSAPGAKLEINPASGYAILAGSSTSTAYRIGNISSPIDDFDAATKAYVDSVAPGGALSLWNGTQNGSIWNGTNGAGNVGIGTTSPTNGFKLDISANNVLVGSDNGLETRTNGVGKVFRLMVPHADSTEKPLMAFFATNSIVSYGGGSSLGNAATKLSFFTAVNSTTAIGTERMTIDSAGNVGIGTTAPRVKLEIKGSYTGQLTLLKLWNEGASIDNTGVDVDFVSTVGGATSGKISNIRTPGNFWDLAFSTYNGSALSERMRIRGNGNVGVGTTAPGAKLEVDATSGYAILAGSSTSTAYRIGNVSTPIDDFDAATKAYVDSVAPGGALSLWNGTQDGNIWNGTNGAGNVGIGTTVPGAKLNVFGKIKLSETSSEWLYSDGSLRFDIDNDNSQTDRAILFSNHNGANELMRIQENGNVGIGTTNPVVKLTLRQADQEYAQLWDTSIGDIAFGIAANTSKISGMDFKNFSSSGQVRLMARNDQNDYLVMNMLGSANATSFFGQTGANAATMFLYGATDTDKKLSIGTYNAGDLILGTSNTERVRVLSTGNVGIGTTAPSARLEVDPALGYAILAGSSTSTAYRIGNVSAPIADFDAATKAYVDAGIASATSSIATVAHYVGATPATYNGANSGTSGYTYAHSKCAEAFPGSHVCTTFEMLDTIQATPANIPTETVWIFNGPPGYTAPSNDCDGRTNNTTAYGAVWHINVAYPQGRGMITLCNNANKLACCQ